MSDQIPIQHPGGLTSGDFTEAEEPLRLFAAWFEEASRTEPRDPNAMALATVDHTGLPNLRMVLMKGFDAQGFVFYSNNESQKGRELGENPRATLLFHWKSVNRQVRLRGPIEDVGPAAADEYFASRPRMAQIGAWASRQSSPLESRMAFEKAIAVTLARFPVGKVPRPPNWVGYRLHPLVMEFWQERPHRLHDRVEFKRDDLAGGWIRTRLYP
jgi:pyridoxamine 5'-phosphate oxidase